METKQPSSFWHLLPIVFALAFIGLGLSYRIYQDTPIGGVTGTVWLNDLHKPIAGAEVVLTPAGNNPYRHQLRTLSNLHGKFLLSRVPTGDYDVSADTPAHSIQISRIHVGEGSLTPVTLFLQRSLSRFEIVQRQRVFGTKEQGRFAVRGYVSDRVPLDKDSYHVQVYRTKLSQILQNKQLASALDALSAADTISTTHYLASLLHPTTMPTPKLVLEKEVAIGKPDVEGFFYKRFALPPLPPGLYLLRLRHQEDCVAGWLQITDMGMVLKQADTQTLAYVVDMPSGDPIPHCMVRCYHENEVRLQTQTNQNGLALFTNPQSPFLESQFFVAQRGDDEVVVKGANFNSSRNNLYTVSIYTERPLYRPGQTIYFKGIARRNQLTPVATGTSDGGSAWSYRLPPPHTPVSVVMNDPKGIQVYSQTLYTNSFGAFNGKMTLPIEATTGTYTLFIQMPDGVTGYTKDIAVAAYRKPEFQVTLTPERPLYVRGEPIRLHVHASYFYGAPLANAVVSYQVFNQSNLQSMDEYDIFPASPDEGEAQREGYYGSLEQEGQTTLDSNGDAVISVPTKPTHSFAFLPQREIADFDVTVTVNNRQEEQRCQVPVVSGDYALDVQPTGYFCLPGQSISVLTTVHTWQQQAVPQQPVTLELAYEKLGNYSDYHRYLWTTLHATTDALGRAVFTFQPPHAGSLQLVLRTRDAKGRSIETTDSIEVYDASYEGSTSFTSTDPTLLTDKRAYTPGETAQLLLVCPIVPSKVLITLEGNRIYRTFTVAMSQHSLVVPIPILKEYGPNVFISACYLGAKASGNNSISVRIPVPDKRLFVTLTPDHPSYGDHLPLYLPGSRVTYHIHVSDAHGRPVKSDLSFAVVDEAIFKLQEESPDIVYRAFYPYRQNSVTTSFSNDTVTLGSEQKAASTIQIRRKFADTALWAPDVLTDSRGNATVSFAVPDNLTTWRATAIAQTMSTQFGWQISKIQVSKPFLLQMELPRLLTQGDQATVTTSVRNDTGLPQNVIVRLQAEGLQIQGAVQQQLHIENAQQATLSWQVTAPLFGSAKLTATAWTLPTSTGGPSFNDGVELPLTVRPFGRTQLASYSGEVGAGNPQVEVFRLNPQTVLSATQVKVHLIPSLASALSDSVDAISAYPYSCVEQTASGLIANLVASKTLPRLGLSASPAMNSAIQENVARLYRLQHDDGAWGWWQYDNDDPWMTAYALESLLLAMKYGYPVAQQVIDSGAKAAIAMLPKTPLDVQPFVLYVLLQCGNRELVAKARSHFILPGLSSENLAYTVLIDKALGRSLNDSLNALLRRARIEGALMHWEGQTVPGFFYADSTYTTLLALQALLTANPQNPLIESGLRWFLLRHADSYWMNTRDMALAIRFLGSYLLQKRMHSPTGTLAISVNGRLVAHVPISAQMPLRDVTVPPGLLQLNKNTVELKLLEGSSPIFYTLEVRSVETTPNDLPLPPLKLPGFQLTRNYYRLSDKGELIPTNDRFAPNESILVRLSFVVPKDMSYVLMEDPLPAGLEVTERGTADVEGDWDYWFSSMDIRDDRLTFFIRSLSKGKHVIDYHLRAQTAGRFTALPTRLQAMYDPDTNVETGSERVEVR
ncbi:large extracellular alpha-helical protein [Chthonomonas calidirosea]|uniref:Large extracellular alpha-helical protein n=1 Tax=Chthonomonas calidirosea (strain DSM 23976 / ICMP 18418 / T49) TaxID=1303518 RepID=S0EW74_CHTCT|nr:alpha-2-macroglobulin family protein [Chthonomonas calidirosea]CCW36061.1 Large extracellular alpha-helical protein [Chthonomonas calidirosea T49]CEK18450.1 large extracellular alpha-helical protein [Chthonomonas calidirosea]